MRAVDELIDESESTWLLVQDWISKSTNNAQLLPVNRHYTLQVTTKSVLRVEGDNVPKRSRSVVSIEELGDLDWIIKEKLGIK